MRQVLTVSFRSKIVLNVQAEKRISVEGYLRNMLLLPANKNSYVLTL